VGTGFLLPDNAPAAFGAFFDSRPPVPTTLAGFSGSRATLPTTLAPVFSSPPTLASTFEGFLAPGNFSPRRSDGFCAPKIHPKSRSRHLFSVFYETNRRIRQAREKKLPRSRISRISRFNSHFLTPKY
jgi:hypothetical protein